MTLVMAVRLASGHTMKVICISELCYYIALFHPCWPWGYKMQKALLGKKYTKNMLKAKPKDDFT